MTKDSVGVVNACLPYDFFMSQLKHEVKIVINRVNERNQQYVKNENVEEKKV